MVLENLGTFKSQRYLLDASMSGEGITYKCFKCGTLIPYERLKMSPDFKCPKCGSKILMKIRHPVVKRVKAI